VGCAAEGELLQRRSQLGAAEGLMQRALDVEFIAVAQPESALQQFGMKSAHDENLCLAILVGEGRISAEMQKRVREMIKTFLERARVKLEEEPLEQEAMLDSPA